MENRKRVVAHKVHPTVINKGYSHAGASLTKRNFKGFVVESGSPAEDINANNYTLRQRSRMLYMSAPIATAALKRQRTNIVGAGLRLKPTIDRETLGMTKEQAEEWQRHVQAEFNLWASRKQACDATGVNTFYGLQQLVALAWPMSGDVFAAIKWKKPTPLMPYSLRLHVIEADRVRTPDLPQGSGSAVRNPFLLNLTTGRAANGNMIYDGVEVDKDGGIVAYHIANSYPNQFDGCQTEFVRVEAYGKETGLPNILHIMDSERPEQYRGVPYLAQAIEPLLQMRRYTEAEITAAVVQSFFTAFIRTESPSNEMPLNEIRGEDQSEVSRGSNDYEMGAGAVNILEPGEDVQFGSPTHPNTGFDTFMRSLCEQVGACLEIPADLLLMSFNASYSASRAALLEAWKGFRMRREWLTEDFCRPVYEIWLAEAVARGRVSAPGFLTDPVIRQAYLGSEWIGPSQGQLDPTKEVQAAVMAIDNGLSTREAEAVKLNGSQFSTNVDKLTVENEQLRAASGGNQPTEAPAEQTPPPDEDGEKEDKEVEDADPDEE
jgi:lambda family phage portal protein